MLKFKNWEEFFASQVGAPASTEELTVVQTGDFHRAFTALEFGDGEEAQIGVWFSAVAPGQTSEFCSPPEGVLIAAIRVGNDQAWNAEGYFAGFQFRLKNVRFGAKFEDYFPQFQENNEWVEMVVAHLPVASFSALCSSKTVGISIAFEPPEFVLEERHFARLRALERYIARGALEKMKQDGAQSADLN